MSGIDWTDAELDALAAYRHAESHEDAREAELALGAAVDERVRQERAEALREAADALKATGDGIKDCNLNCHVADALVLRIRAAREAEGGDR